MVLLAVSVSQFGLSVSLNPVRHHPSSRSQKFLPSQPAAVLLRFLILRLSLSVQLHLNRLKGRNVLYKAQTTDISENIKLT